MTTHRPKTAALIAYDAGVLSEDGRVRLERHLAGCEACRAELAAARLWTRESARIRTLSERPPVDFARMELAIAREAGAQAQVGRVARAWRALERVVPVLALAAAALLTVGLAQLSGPIVRPARMPAAEAGARPEPASWRAATVTLASGDAHVARAGATRPARGGEAVVTGESLVVGEGEIHARFAPRTGVAASGPAEVALARLDADVIEVRLAGGRLAVESALGASAIEALTTPGMRSSTLFVVLAASYRIEARVARFEVELDVATGALSLSVEEGTVVLVEGDERTVLTGPVRWPTDGAARGGARLAQVVGLAPDADAWPTLEIAREGIVRWELGDLSAVGGERLSVRVPPGAHELVGWDAAGIAFRHRAVVGAGGLVVEGDALVPDAPRVRDGYLPRGVLMSIVGESGGRLTHCYEQALRLRALSGDVTARVRLSPRGAVIDVRILTEDPPASLERCVTAEAERWTFPPPGGPMSFDVPLRFRSR